MDDAGRAGTQASAAWEITLGALLLAVGAGVVVAAGYGRRKALQSLRWMRTPAEVLATSVEHDEAAYPRVRYRYHVAGKSYEGDRRGIIERGYAFPKSAGKVLSQYRVGETITVWVNPSDHAEAVIERGQHMLAVIGFFSLGAIFAGAGATLLAFGIRRALGRT